MSPESFLDGRVTLWPGDCLDALARLEPDSVDSCVTDPPYHLASIVKRFGADDAAPAKAGKTGAFARASKGFMGKRWDGGDIAFRPETWAAVARVLKPGGHLLAFGAPKNFGLMQVALMDAGFEIRDVIAWLFGTGFPKSHSMSKAIERQMGEPHPSALEWEGWGTALKPAYEPIIMARKPLAMSTIARNVLGYGTGAINIDACRVWFLDGDTTASAPRAGLGAGPESVVGKRVYGNGLGGTIVPPHQLGRWPANVIHDGSAEVIEAFPHTKSGASLTAHKIKESENTSMAGKNYARSFTRDWQANEGSAARFFYSSKATAEDRIGSKHPTVKPLDLFRYLIRLVTPKGGLVIDPFAGTGTAGEAAYCEGMRAVLMEAEDEYQDDIRRRMALVLAGPEERARAVLKARGKLQPPDDLPLWQEREAA